MTLKSIFTLLSALSLFALAQTILSQEANPSKTPTDAPRSPVTSDEPQQSISYTQEDLAVLIGNVQRPNGIAWLDNMLYTACNGDWTLYAIDDTSGETETFLFGIRDAHTLYAEETDSGFNLWIPDFDTNTLYLVDQSRTSAIPIIENLDSPWGITPYKDNTFLITSLRGNNILVATRDGQTTELIGGLRAPTGITTQNDIIYVANTGSARRSIEWVDTNAVDDQPRTLITGLRNVTELDLGADGNLYFAYSLGTRGVVGRINPQDCLDVACSAEDVEIIIYSDLPAPLAGLTVTPDMRIFLHTIYRPEIYWVQIEG